MCPISSARQYNDDQSVQSSLICNYLWCYQIILPNVTSDIDKCEYLLQVFSISSYPDAGCKHWGPCPRHSAPRTSKARQCKQWSSPTLTCSIIFTISQSTENAPFPCRKCLLVLSHFKIYEDTIINWAFHIPKAWMSARAVWLEIKHWHCWCTCTLMSKLEDTSK